MKYTTEMGSGHVTYEYIPRFKNVGSGIQKQMRGVYTDVERGWIAKA
jgi:hypothetical protein